MAKSLSGAAATFMPPHILSALAPAPPIAPLRTEEEVKLREELREEAVRLREEAGLPPPRLSGVAGLLGVFEKELPAPRPVALSRDERKALRRSERIAAAAKAADEGLAKWDPKAEDPRKTSDGCVVTPTCVLGRSPVQAPPFCLSAGTRLSSLRASRTRLRPGSCSASWSRCVHGVPGLRAGCLASRRPPTTLRSSAR